MSNINPKYYNKGEYELIDIAKHASFSLGNVLKYTYRHMEKNGLEDLKKALYYANTMEEIEKNITKIENQKALYYFEQKIEILKNNNTTGFKVEKQEAIEYIIKLMKQYTS